MLDECQAINAWHHDIQHDERGLVFFEEGDCALHTVGSEDFEAERAQDLSYYITK